MDLRPFRIEADWVWPVTSVPLRSAAVLVGSDGLVAEVGPAAAVPAPAGCETRRLPGGSVILPGLVNAHTHLELTGLRNRVDEDDFFDWIQHIRRAKAEFASTDFEAAARDGLRECWRFGTTAVADTGDTGAACSALTELGGRGVVYLETFGPHPEQASASLAALQARFEAVSRQAGPRVSIGVSPHAPYSVSEDLFRLTATFARERGLRIASHAAESRAEQQLITSFAGPFAAMWRDRGIPAPREAPSTVALLERAGVLGPDVLLIHGVRLSDADIDTLQRSGCSVVLCPGSNLRHGHGLPRARRLLDRGIAVAIGTDSVASVPDTNLLREARIAVAELGVSPLEAIRMMTVDGARAIGLSHSAGVLQAGRPADICCLRIGRVAAGAAVAQAVVRAGEGAFLETYVGGARVYPPRST